MPLLTDVIVVGAGAAGLMASIHAARTGADVLLLESTADGGRKILISGGGRCNILPSEPAPDRFVTDSSPNTLRKILRSWPLPEQVEFFEKELGQRLVREDDTGKLFPQGNRAREVRDRLVQRVKEAGAGVRFDTRVERVHPRTEGGWTLTCGDGFSADAATVVLAAGGLSVPATGSDGHILEGLTKLGVTVHEPYPALTPLVVDPPAHGHLAGVSLDVTIRAAGVRPRFETSGGFLFTHRGYSGPAVLDASHLAVRTARTPTDGSELGGEPLRLLVAWDGASREVWDERLRSGSEAVGSLLQRCLPRRLAGQLLMESQVVADTRTSQLTRVARRRLVATLTQYSLSWTGDEGYRKAEVTGGGIALSSIDAATMESRRHPGLYICGELLDAFGPIGGHNFMWAWATGRAAGVAAAKAVAASRRSA